MTPPDEEAGVPPRIFTLEEAEALLPRVEPVVRRLVELRRALKDIQAVLQEFRDVAARGGGAMPTGRFAEARAEAERLMTGIAAGVREIEGWGCVIKDLDQGLVDFLWRRRGATVFLCWKLGEPAIRHWHGLREGFAGRKPIEEE
jgi:hypothetical protein